MTDTKWTPGPWRYSKQDAAVFTESGVAIASIHYSDFDGEIFAAGPEMYEALKDALSVIEIYHKEKNPEWDGSAESFSVIGKARAALAKARGDAMNRFEQEGIAI